jgi:hypothetical protein
MPRGSFRYHYSDCYRIGELHNGSENVDSKDSNRKVNLSLTTKTMHWVLRLGFLSFGLFLMVAAKRQLDMGQWVFLNASYHQTTFAAGGFGIGALICLLAFLPPDKWVYKHMTTRRSKGNFLDKKPTRRWR